VLGRRQNGGDYLGDASSTARGGRSRLVTAPRCRTLLIGVYYGANPRVSDPCAGLSNFNCSCRTLSVVVLAIVLASGVSAYFGGRRARQAQRKACNGWWLRSPKPSFL